MLARIKSNRWIYFENITTPEEDILYEYFSVESPNAKYIDTSTGQWSGVFRKYDKNNHRISRGYLGELILMCEEKGLMLDVVDDREAPQFNPMDPDDIRADFLPGITLEQYQIEAIQKACKIEVGLYDLPTGAGKGELIAGTCKAIQCPTAIISDQTVVVEQLKTRLELREISEDVGLFFSGKMPNGQRVIVGTIQSLTLPKAPSKPDRLPDEEPAEFKKRHDRYLKTLKAFRSRYRKASLLRKMVGLCDMLIVDEADRATSKSYRDIFMNVFKGRRRYGFSGTCIDPDKPVQKLLLQEFLGSIIFKETTRHVESLNRIVPLECYMITFGDESRKHEKDAFDLAVKEHIVTNTKFHEDVARLCTRLPSDEGVMILVDRDDLGDALVETLAQLGHRAEFLHGKTPKPKRKVLIKQFENREYRILIGGKVVFRGLDLCGGVENMIIGTGGKLWSELRQKVGRAARLNKNGVGRVFDYYFLCNEYLYRHSRARLKAYIAMGYPTYILHGKNRIEGAKLIHSRFRLPKKS